MSLAELAKAGPSGPDKGPTCTACQLVASLPEGEAAALQQMLSDPMWRYTAIADALAAEGHNVAEYVLSRHSRGQCSARRKLR